MQISNNIFKKENNNIFYMKLKGDVYQAKIENIIYQINSIRVNDMIDYFKFNGRYISSIKINVASKGEMVWYDYDYSCSGAFYPTNLYRSVEDCVNEVNPIFKCKGFSIVMNNIDEIFVGKEDFVPNFAEWYNDSIDFVGHEVYMLRTYRWDGTKAKLERVQTNPYKFKGKVFYNSNWDSCFDLVNEEWLIDEEYANGCYKTYEECVNANFVKVHTF